VVDSPDPPGIYVLAGPNGAGKSSLLGAVFELAGLRYFNPDAAARQIAAANPGLTIPDANSAAWYEGKRLLETAIARRLRFAFETTLGGKTITGLLERALTAGIPVRIWYVGLVSPELHIARVRQRVQRGGHTIPEAIIRQRYLHSRLNLIRLLPRLTELWVYDNSIEGDPATPHSAPQPKLLLHWFGGKIVGPEDLAQTPEWAKPIVATALKHGRHTEE
jgi:predicted ABC-type ATPase